MRAASPPRQMERENEMIVISHRLFSSSSQKREHDAAGDRGAEDAGEVRTHRMHQKEDAAAFLLPDEMGDAGSDRNGGDTGGTDQRIDTAA